MSELTWIAWSSVEEKEILAGDLEAIKKELEGKYKWSSEWVHHDAQYEDEMAFWKRYHKLTIGGSLSMRMRIDLDDGVRDNFISLSQLPIVFDDKG